MTAERAKVVGQNVAIERFTQLGAERTATDATGQATEDGARHGTEGDADRSGKRADGGPSLAPGEGSADAARSTTQGADGSSDFHGLMESSYLGGMTARTLQ